LRLAAQAFAEACSSLLGLGQIAFAFWASFIGNCICVLSQIFLYSYIIKASHRLTPYRLKGKKGVGRLRTPYCLKNYGFKLFMPLKQNSLLCEYCYFFALFVSECRMNLIHRPLIVVAVLFELRPPLD
jgi:hypothetical protein